MSKARVGLIGSAVATLIGVYLQLNAHALAWHSFGGSYSGPPSETLWGQKEIAFSHIGIALMSVGVLLFVVTYIHWLFDKKPE